MGTQHTGAGIALDESLEDVLERCEGALGHPVGGLALLGKLKDGAFDHGLLLLVFRRVGFVLGPDRLSTRRHLARIDSLPLLQSLSGRETLRSLSWGGRIGIHLHRGSYRDVDLPRSSVRGIRGRKRRVLDDIITERFCVEQGLDDGVAIAMSWSASRFGSLSLGWQSSPYHVFPNCGARQHVS